MKVIKLYVIWMIIYFPLALVDLMYNETGLVRETLLYARGFFLRGEQYNSWPLWYLLSTIYALLLLIYLQKKR